MTLLSVPPAAVQGGSWVRQADNVCFSARELQDTEIFLSSSNGLIGGVRFIHSHGGVSCAETAPLTNFGCNTELMTVLVSETKDAAMYPAAMTEDTTIFSDFSNSIQFAHYTMPRQEDGILTLIQPIYSVQRGDRFHVEYTEVYNGRFTSDNSGTSCVSVDFLFLSCHEDWNLPDRNCTDATSTEDAAHVSGAEVLVQ